MVDLLAGSFAPVPGEEETVKRKENRKEEEKEKKRRGGREIGVWSEQRNRCNGRGLLCCSESGGRGKCEGAARCEGDEDQHVKSMPWGEP